MKRPSPVPGFVWPPSHPAELLEDQPLVLGRIAGPRSRTSTTTRPFAGARAHLDLPAGRRVLDGVVDQVRQHLAQPRAVAADARQRRRDLRSTRTSSWPIVGRARPRRRTSAATSTSANE